LECFTGQRLNEYIGHYEGLEYDAGEVHGHHKRVKRWLEGVGSDEEEPDVHVNFHAHERHFRLRLRRDTSAFSDNLLVEGDGGGSVGPGDLAHLFTGHLDGNIYKIVEIMTLKKRRREVNL
jgi:disintegrin and metalloproteinase domain-containing protein 10